MRMDEIVYSNLDEVGSSTEISFYIQRIKSNIREFLLSENDKKELEYTTTVVKNGVYELQHHLSKLQNAIKHGTELSKENEHKMFGKLKHQADRFATLVNQTFAINDKQGHDAAHLFFNTELEPLSREFQKAAKYMENFAEQEIIAACNETKTAIKNAITISIIATITALLMAISLGYLIAKTISIPIANLKDAAIAIGHGNLDTSIHVHFFPSCQI